MAEKDISLGIGALNTDISAQNADGKIVTYALNSGLEGFTGEIPLRTNEPSNLLCTAFKTGYKVIGTLNILEENKTIYFLVNPETGASEIGQIFDSTYIDKEDELQDCTDCTEFYRENSPLETIAQVPICAYQTIVSADCLNFKIEHPVRSRYKLEKCGTVIYFTDDLNDLRFINIDDYPKQIVSTDGCAPIFGTELDCNAIKIFPDFFTPKIDILEVVSGGQLVAGTYQFTVAYSDGNGSGLSHYFEVSGPVPIFDPNKSVTTRTDYETDRAVKFQVSELLHNFYTHINLAVVKTVNRTSSVEFVGTFAINNPTFVYIYTGVNKSQIKLTIDDIAKRNPFYSTAKDVNDTNGILMWAGLSTRPDMNLQRIANRIKLQWATLEEDEDFYTIPEHTAEYKGFMGDEVYALGIAFEFDNGQTSCTFHVPGISLADAEEANGFSLTTEVTNKDVIDRADCDEPSNKYWQVYNTAVNLGLMECAGTEATTQTTRQTTTITCNSPSFRVQIVETDDEAIYEFYQHSCPSSGATFNGYAGTCSIAGSSANNCMKSQLYGLLNPSVVSTSEQLVFEYDKPQDSCGRYYAHRQCTYKVAYDVIVDIPATNPGCVVHPHEYGTFAYWESIETYPNNEDVWGELSCRPIRHHKFPDSCVAHIHENADNSGDRATRFRRRDKIYPKGIKVKIEGATNDGSIKGAIKWGVDNGFITQEQANTIVGFRIMHGNRVGNKSIVGKGLLYDMMAYGEFPSTDVPTNLDETVFFPNYPYNDLHDDPFIWSTSGLTNGNPIHFDDDGNPIYPGPLQHPYKNENYINDRYAWISPETSFNSPTLGTDLKLETVEYGTSRGWFVSVDNHAGYKIINESGSALAAIVAGFETQIEIAATGLIQQIVADGTGATMKHYNEWIQIIEGFSKYRNFAKYYVSDSNYNSFCCVPNGEGDKIRHLDNATYLKPYPIELNENNETVKINNWERESSVYLKTNDFFPAPQCDGILDNSRFLLSNNEDGLGCLVKGQGGAPQNSAHHLETNERYRDVMSYYASVKHYLPGQYGSVLNIEYLDTGYYGKINWNVNQNDDCEIAFGGDIFIGPWGYKRKYPFFIQNATGFNDGDDIQYTYLSNAGTASYFFNTTNDEETQGRMIMAGLIGTVLLPSYPGILFAIHVMLSLFKEPPYNFDCEVIGNTLAHYNDNIPDPNVDYDLTDKFFIDGSFYLFSYGIPYSYVESEFNLWYRHAENEREKNFYPNITDVKTWTQEANVSIKEDNYYFYNRDYSKQNLENFFCIQRTDFDKNKVECRALYENRVIYSEKDDNIEDTVDGWRRYLPNNYYDFPKSSGKLTAIDSVDDVKVLARFDNSFAIYNAFYTLNTEEAALQVGDGGMFKTAPQRFEKTDLGYAGSQNKAMVNTPYGKFWVDAKRGEVVNYVEGGGATVSSRLDNISNYGMNNWFRNNLPFGILQDFPDMNIDNSFLNVGMTMCYDARFERVFLTKKDAVVRDKYKNLITEEDGHFYITLNTVKSEIYIDNDEYFCDKSWTLAWDCKNKFWLSWYSFKPDYYVAKQNYFSSGINYGTKPSMFGLWSHLRSPKSYQVFYGDLYPFIVENVVQSKLTNKILNYVEYENEVTRWHNNFDFYEKRDVTFNKSIIYNNKQCSGLLFLNPSIENNLQNSARFPKYNGNGIDIEVNRTKNVWRFNQFYDQVRNEYNGMPVVNNSCALDTKAVNQAAVQYNKPSITRQRLSNDWYKIMMIADKYSNYKFSYKWQISDYNIDKI